MMALWPGAQQVTCLCMEGASRLYAAAYVQELGRLAGQVQEKAMRGVPTGSLPWHVGREAL